MDGRKTSAPESGDLGRSSAAPADDSSVAETPAPALLEATNTAGSSGAATVAADSLTPRVLARAVDSLKLSEGMPDRRTEPGPAAGAAAELAAFSGLQIYLPCVDASGLVPAETAAALFCLLSAGVPPGWLRLIVWRDPPADALPAVRVRLPVPAVAEEQLPARVAACTLPAAHLPQLRLCVAGLCAVVRRAVRTVDRVLRPDAGHYNERDTGLLGFRRGTLAPPADASLWTRFVERDVPASLRRLLSGLSAVEADSTGAAQSPSGDVPSGCDGAPAADSSAAEADSTTAAQSPSGDVPSGCDGAPAADSSATRDAVVSVPPALVKFDHHMKQPLRVHNVWKQEQRAGGRQRRWGSGDHRTSLQCVRHTYAEGHVLTISDLLLYPCFRLMKTLLTPHGLRLEEVAPTSLDWMQAVESRPGVLQLWSQLVPPTARSIPTRRLRLQVPDVAPESLYKKDPVRYEPKKRAFTVQAGVEAALACVEAAGFRSRVEPHPGSGRLGLEWARLPAAASPADGGLPASRLQRKHHQLENLAWLATRLARPGDTVVDFCSGGGHVGLLLAVLLPQCHLVLVENKEESLERARNRLETLRLSNVSLYQCNMEFYQGDFQLGVALHACGVATDIVMQRCLAVGAALLCCPCCYGAVHPFDDISYPRSACGRSTGLSSREWLVLGHAADQTHSDGSEKSVQGRRCMALVDSDRAAFLAEAGYQTLLTVAEPADCSNKNHLLVAVPPGWRRDGSLLAD